MSTFVSSTQMDGTSSSTQDVLGRERPSFCICIITAGESLALQGQEMCLVTV